MKFKVNEITDVNKLVKRYRSFLSRISVVRTLISAFFFTSVIAFGLLITSTIIFSISAKFAFVASVLIIMTLLFILKEGRISLATAALLLDDEIKAKYQLVTFYELSNHDLALKKSDFANIIKRRILSILTEVKQLKKPLIQQPLQLLGLFFFGFASLIIFLTPQQEITVNNATVEKTQQALLAEITKLEAYAKLSNDENILRLIEQAKKDILSGEFNALTDLIADINTKLNEKKNQQETVAEFIQNTVDKKISAAELKRKLLNFAKNHKELKSAAELSEMLGNQEFYSLDEILDLLKLTTESKIDNFADYFEKFKKTTSELQKTEEKVKKNDSNQANVGEESNNLEISENVEPSTKITLQADFIQTGDINLHKIQRLQRYQLSPRYKKLRNKFSKIQSENHTD